MEEETAGEFRMEWSQDEPSSSDPHQDEEESLDEGLPADTRTKPGPIRNTSIPHHLAQTCSPLKSVGCPSLSFTLNGRLVPTRPGGGSTKLTLRGLPGGSASGFTSVQTLIAPEPRRPSGPLPGSSPTSWRGPAPGGDHTPRVDHTPIITDVVSGEAAHRVLSGNQVIFKSNSPASPSKTHKARPLSRKRPGLPHCSVCRSHYKLVSELRGFLCMCSPDVAQSLKELKKRRSRRLGRRSRDENKSSKRSRVSAENSPTKVVSPLRSPLGPTPLPRPTYSGPSPSTVQLTEAVAPPLGPLPQCKLVILVEDFYYGSAPGNRQAPLPQKPCRPFRCTLCPETLDNNISLMSHTHEHLPTVSQPSLCPHCLRCIPSPYKLQQHVEQAHVRKMTVTCRICELAFDSEPDFLWHMRSTHRPGEMPYSCQVCNFRSSFFSDVWTHFQDVHANSENLLCHYCLRVLRRTSCYQQHLVQHQSKRSYSCEQCRLHFLYTQERLEHKTTKHTTHVKPPQLCGLKPGTKVTVRTYSVIGGIAPCEVVNVPPTPPPPEKPPKRKRLESLGELLWSVSPDRGSDCPLRCVECLSYILDISVHFPSAVCCSLCRFSTCCSASYAHHMLSHHMATGGQHRPSKQPHFYLQQHRLSDTLQCVSCSLSTHSGDQMAIHLEEQPQHSCIMLTHNDTQSEANNAADDTGSEVSLPVRAGSFVPIQLGSTHQPLPQVSIEQLPGPPQLSFLPAMTVRFLGRRSLRSGVPLTKAQLAVVLSALCHGVPQAALRFRTSPQTIRHWMEQHRRGLAHRERLTRTDAMTEWVLNHREKQLRLDEDVLLLMAGTTLTPQGHGPWMEIGYGQDRPLPKIRDRQLLYYTWMVDFMMRQKLGRDSSTRTLTYNLQIRRNGFVQTLNNQIRNRAFPPRAVGCFDEFPVFVDLDRLQNQDRLALQFSQTQKERPLLDAVLCALSDGTFLPPLLFFFGCEVDVPDGFPDNVLIESHLTPMSQKERLHIWTRKVWWPAVASRIRVPSLLIADPHREHQTRTFRSLMSDSSTTVFYIPAGCCCSVQPLDLCITPVLRDFLQARWIQLVSNGGLDGLSLSQLALTLACWFSEISSTLSSESLFLSRSFSSVLDLQQATEQATLDKMIVDLTQAVLQPLETRRPGVPGPGLGPEPGLETQPRPEPGLELGPKLGIETRPEPGLERGTRLEPGSVELGPEPGPEAGPGPALLKEVKAEEEELLVDSLSSVHQLVNGEQEVA